MKRRNFIIGTGALAAGGGAALGTGAFSAATAERDISVEVADDADAYLALESDSEYAEEVDGVIELDLGQDLGEDQGEHVGLDSSYFFGSGDSDYNVFTVENQGTEEVQVEPIFQAFYFDEDGDQIEFVKDPEDEFEAPEAAEMAVALGIQTGNDPEEGQIKEGHSRGYYVSISTSESAPDEVTATFEINATTDF